MQVETTRFGTLEIAPEAIVTFSEGLLGFPNLKRFVLIEHPGGPFEWLQSVDEPAMAFPTLDPAWVRDEYSVRLEDADLDLLGLGPDGGHISVMAIVNVGDPSTPTINLLAPICLANDTRRGIQLVQHNQGLLTRHPLRTRTPEREVA